MLFYLVHYVCGCETWTLKSMNKIKPSKYGAIAKSLKFLGLYKLAIRKFLDS